MEGFSNNIENGVSSFEKEAQARISKFSGFNEMPLTEKEVIAKKLVDELADRSLPDFDFKKNIAIAYEVGKIFLAYKEEERHRAQLKNIGVTV